MSEDRYLRDAILHDAVAEKKIAFVVGPRQVGKTTLVKSLLPAPENYFSYDSSAFQRVWAKNPDAAIASRMPGVFALDEIHKDRAFKRKIKGIYDKTPEAFLVTGSARLDFYRKGSDSLLGRYIPYRLYPFTVGERAQAPRPDDILVERRPVRRWHDLVAYGAFPEPFSKGTSAWSRRWSRLRRDRLVLEDSRDLTSIHDLNRFRLLINLLPERVASQLSINALREDVGAAYATVRSHMQIVEALYYGFTVKPYAKSIKRALTSEPKFYLFDTLALDEKDKGRINENLAALHLAKACDFFTDTAQGEFELRYVRDKEKREADFLVLRDKKPWLMIECKSGETEVDANLLYFARQLKMKHVFQLVDKPNYRREYPALGVTVMSYERFFSGWV